MQQVLGCSEKVDLQGDDAVDRAAANVSQYHNLVSSLLQDQGMIQVEFCPKCCRSHLDRGEDPGNGAKREQENRDG